jgi:hypothetical protein
VSNDVKPQKYKTGMKTWAIFGAAIYGISLVFPDDHKKPAPVNQAKNTTATTSTSASPTTVNPSNKDAVAVSTQATTLAQPQPQVVPSHLKRIEDQKAFEQLWQEMKAANTRRIQLLKQPAWSKMNTWLMKHAEVRAELLARFIREGDPNFRIKLRELIRVIGTDDVATFFLSYFDHPQSSYRQEALYVLSGALSHTSKVQDKLRKMLKTETDENTLILVLGMLYPTLQLTQQDLGEMGDRLVMLAKHPNAMLRLNSLTALVKFDRTAAITEDLLFKALSDRDSRVRSTAIRLIAEERLQSERIKSGLFSVLTVPVETRANRLAALNTLGFFKLNDAEAALFSKYNTLYR